MSEPAESRKRGVRKPKKDAPTADDMPTHISNVNSDPPTKTNTKTKTKEPKTESDAPLGSKKAGKAEKADKKGRVSKPAPVKKTKSTSKLRRMLARAEKGGWKLPASLRESDKLERLRAEKPGSQTQPESQAQTVPDEPQPENADGVFFIDTTGASSTSLPKPSIPDVDDDNPMPDADQADEQDDFVIKSAADNLAKPPADPTSSKSRLIVFVGNLPWTTTTATLSTFFAPLNPTAIRHSTVPPKDPHQPTNPPADLTPDDLARGEKGDPYTSKGFAFVELPTLAAMNKALENYHRVEFTAGPKSRLLNVELTAGGGGNTTDRRERIREKNKSLKEERKEKLRNGKGKRGAKAPTGARREENKAEQAHEAAAAHASHGGDGGGIHPARLAMMNRGGKR